MRMPWCANCGSSTSSLTRYAGAPGTSCCSKRASHSSRVRCLKSGDEFLVQLVVVLGARVAVDETRVVPQVGTPHGVGEPLPELGGRRQVDGQLLPVGGIEPVHLREPRPRPGVGHHALRLVERQRLADERSDGLHLRRLDLLADAGALARHQRRQDAERAEEAGQRVRERGAPGARVVRVGEQREQPAHRLPHGVVARPVAVRPALPEPGQRAVDDARVACGRQSRSPRRAAP